MKESQKNRSAVIVAGFRTPFMLSGRDFKDIREEELGACTIKELIERTGVKKEDIEELIVGNSEGTDGQLAFSMARMLGLSDSVSASTVKKGDLSSFESLLLAAIKIKYGLVDIVVAGGVDSASQKPFLCRSNKIKDILRTQKWKEKAQLVLSLRLSDLEWSCQLGAERLNGSYGPDYDKMFAHCSVSRVQQEQWVSKSFQKAQRADKEGKIKQEIIPVFPPFNFDMKSKDGALSRPIFKGANSYDMGPEEWVFSHRRALQADGAVFFLIMSQEKALSLGYKPLISLYAFANSKGGEQDDKTLGPVYAVKEALKKTGLLAHNISLWEIGESYPLQTLSCLKAFAGLSHQTSPLKEVDPAKCNVNGGALALGDPLGATSARMVLNLMWEMKRQKVEWGMVTMGLSSHQAGALILKNVSDSFLI